MKAIDILEFFDLTYPGVKISRLPEINPTEIICEVEPSSNHAEYSTAIAAIAKSRPHFHKASTETYTVLKGELKMNINDKTIVMKSGDTCTVNPYEVHWAEGDFTIVRVTSKPGWTPEDHILSDN